MDGWGNTAATGIFATIGATLVQKALTKWSRQKPSSHSSPTINSASVKTLLNGELDAVVAKIARVQDQFDIRLEQLANKYDALIDDHAVTIRSQGRRIKDLEEVMADQDRRMDKLESDQ